MADGLDKSPVAGRDLFSESTGLSVGQSGLIFESKLKEGLLSTNKSGSRKTMARLRTLHGSHLQVNISSDIELLKRQILSYRTMYLLCAGYTVSLTLLVSFSTKYFLESIDYPDWGSVSTFLLFTWVLKPVFGFLADWIYLWNYRFKGYFCLLGFMNFLLMCGCLAIVPNVQDKTIEPTWLIVMVCLASTNLAAIDSMTLGMTSIVRNLENRLISMQNARTDETSVVNSNPTSFSFITNYLTYISVRYGARPIYNLIGYEAHEIYKENNLYIKIDYCIIAALSLYLTIHSLCFFRELKQSSRVRAGVSIKDHFRQFLNTLTKDGTYWLMFFGAIALLFPLEDFNLTEILNAKRAHSESVQIYSWFGGATLVVSVCLTMVYKRVRSLTNPHYFILAIFVTQLVVTVCIWTAFTLVDSVWVDNLLIAVVSYLGYIYVIIACAVCIQTMVKHTKEGYELFSLNMVIALMNLCSLGSQFYYFVGLRHYMKDEQFSNHSVGVVCSIALAYVVVTGSLAAIVMIKKRAYIAPRSRISSTERISI